MNSLKGFSLIELMVVIAIVAVIAAIAAPQYKNYVIRAKTAEIAKTVDDLAQRSIQYAAVHGFFPSAYDLGLSTTLDKQTVDDPSQFYPAEYFATTGTGIEVWDVGIGHFPCGDSGGVRIAIDAYVIGIPGVTTAGQYIMNFEAFLYHFNGIINIYHFYYVGIPGGGTIPGDFVGGWNNYIIDSIGTENPAVTGFLNNVVTECQ